jgi:hypothetical protein
MMKSPKSKYVVWERSVLAVAASMCLAASVWAQSAQGFVYGRAKAGAVVTLVNLNTGFEQKTQASVEGDFKFSHIPPGHYRVMSGDTSRDADVSMDAGIQVDFLAEMPEISVSGRKGQYRVDMLSVESSTLFTQEKLRTLPVARSPDAVALLAPGVVRGDSGLGRGGLPSFGGASVGENGYYINGFDVTNIRNFLSYAELPFDAIDQQRTKTGGYGAEYGRSLGGVISLVTKRGDNEWKGGAAVYWEPQSLRATGRDVSNLNPGKTGNYTVYNSRDTQDSASVVAYLGGPLIKDRLFVFGLVEQPDNRTEDFDHSTNVRTRSTQPTGLLKLDWVLNEQHRLEFTGINNKQKTRYTDYNNATDYSTSFDGVGEVSHSETGGEVAILSYNGQLTPEFNVSVTAGRVNYLVNKVTGSRMRSDCPVVYDADDAKLGCWPGDWPGPTVTDPNAPDDMDKRRAWRLDLEYKLAAHTLRAGLDQQVFRSSSAGTSYFAGAYYQYLVSSNGYINNMPNVVAPGTTYVSKTIKQTTSGSYEARNQAFYIEDSWLATPRLMLYGGLRTESFDNRNAQGVSFVKTTPQLAPRTGFAWDALGDASTKIFGTAGRYYIPVATNTNVRMTRGDLYRTYFYTYSGRDPVTQAPLGLSQPIGSTLIKEDDQPPPDPATVASKNLKPMFQDEYILGFQHALSPQWGFGVKGTYRTVKNGMDDFCGHYPMMAWAADNGYNQFDPNKLSSCILLNPGRDVTMMMDVNNDGNLKKVTIPESYFGLGPYKRNYYAIELSVERPLSGRWGFQGSYTWSRSVGTSEGYVRSDLDQADGGITQDFDEASFTHGANGYLPNDRRHIFKFLGNYLVTDQFKVGATATIASGRPISCLGFVPLDSLNATEAAEVKEYTTASSYYCLNDQGQSVLHTRGSMGRTPWTAQLDVQLSYSPSVSRGKLTLVADIFNIFNQQATTEVQETRDYSRDTTASGQLNANYGTPTSFMAPRSVRLTARYEF